MSMTYYAVTDDPNELAHWGIKGMKWGVRHDKPRHPGSRRPRSLAYKKAQSKLQKMMKSGIKKAEASWKAYNSPQAKYERQTNRAIQLARKGKLKYGKLSDEQVRRVTERLDLERQARQLSNQEQTFRHRLAKSISEGVVTGIGQGFGRRASEFIARGSVLKTDRMRAEQQDELDRRKEKRRMRNAEREAKKKAEREFRQQQRKDAYEHERDKKYLEEKTRNAHLYGVNYDSDGKLSGADYAKLYGSSNKGEQAKVRKQERLEARNTTRQRRENERIARQEAAARKKEYTAAARRIEEQQKRLEAANEAERLKQYRKGMSELSSSASKRDQDRAWESKQARIRENQEREAYRSNVKRLADESGRHSKTTSGWRQMDKMEYHKATPRSQVVSSFGGSGDHYSSNTYRPIERKRQRKGKR